MEITIRVRRSGGRSVPSEGRRRSGRLSWHWLGAAALGAGLLLMLAVAGKVRAARSQPGAAAPALEVTSLSVRRAGALVAVEGTVRNRSTERLQYVWVRGSFEDAAGHAVSSSDDALIEAAKLGPDESASFRLYGIWKPGIAQCSLEFSHTVQVRLPAAGAAALVQDAVKADGPTAGR